MYNEMKQVAFNISVEKDKKIVGAKKERTIRNVVPCEQTRATRAMPWSARLCS